MEKRQKKRKKKKEEGKKQTIKYKGTNTKDMTQRNLVAKFKLNNVCKCYHTVIRLWKWGMEGVVEQKLKIELLGRLNLILMLWARRRACIRGRSYLCQYVFPLGNSQSPIWEQPNRTSARSFTCQILSIQENCWNLKVRLLFFFS